jgi:hypothetical protein
VWKKSFEGRGRERVFVGSRQRKRSQTTVWSKNGCYIACQSGLALIERLSTEAKRFLNVSLTRSRASRESQPSGAFENFLFSDSAIETPALREYSGLGKTSRRRKQAAAL